MSAALSDVVGFLGSACLLVPPVKDQWSRFKEDHEARQESESEWPGLHAVLSSAWRGRREGYSGLDSLFTLVGAGGLIVAFLLKMNGN